MVQKGTGMRIAIPLSGEQLSQHFGHSERFLFVDADMEQRKVLHRQVEKAPDHVRGLLPAWLAERSVDLVIASGLGARARDLLAASSIDVLTGVSVADPEVLIGDFVNGRLRPGPNACDESQHNCGH
jgi:predicted Fe-Mo cluster-binding NifX family protein